MSKKCKAIEQYDLHTGDIVASYSSGKDCSEATGTVVVLFLCFHVVRLAPL